MPAKSKRAPKRPRIQITPSPELWRLVDLVHERTGTARSAVIAELLDQVSPVLETMIHALEIVSENPRQAQRLLANFASEKIGDLMQVQLELDHTLTQKELELPAADGRTVKGKRARRRSSGTT